MLLPADVPTLVQTIQQAVAPVFLLTGIGALLSVLVNRFGRIVDRFRKLEMATQDGATHHESEMTVLARRAKWVHRAITLATVAALLVCIVIVALFIGAELAINTSSIIALMFVSTMFVLITSLLCFLREIALASGYLNMRKELTKMHR